MRADFRRLILAGVSLCLCLSMAHAQKAPATVDAPFQVRYGANLQYGDSYMDIINTGLNGAPPLGPGFGTANTGNICVNVYALDPEEELISCCSCLITPGQTVNLGVDRDVLSNTLTGAIPTSVTVKLVGSNANASNCTNTAAMVTPANMLPGGFVAFMTTLHTNPSGSHVYTEAPFTPAGIGNAGQGADNELNSLAGRCAFIIGNAGGYGICKACRQGALGGQKH